MCNTFEDSVVTIAAMDSHDSNGRCFIPDESRKHIRIEFDIIEGEKAYVYVRRRRFLRIPRYVTHGLLGSINLEPVLESRGWTLQELVLSPRLLYYTACELGWECQTHKRCECEILPHTDSYSHARQTSLHPGLFSGFSDRNPTEIHKLWPTLVMNFTRRNLTFQADRLLANSGLAAAMKRCTSGTYMFGIWKEDIIRHLI